MQKFTKLSIIQPGIARFRSNFVQTLITWRLMYHELSRSTGQRSRSRRDITYQEKNAIIYAKISCGRPNLLKIISEPSATRYTAFKVIRSTTENAITSPRIARLRWNWSRHRRYIANVQGQRSKIKVAAWSNVSAAIIRQWIEWIDSSTSNLAWNRN